MDIGIGLPNSVPGVSVQTLVRWAHKAERLGFSSLATIDRLVYPNFEPLTTLAAVAATTEQIRLVTGVLIAPLHANTAMLAKQAATIDQLSHGRLTLGLAIGSRPDDYTASHLDMVGRGKTFDEQLARLNELWDERDRSGEPSPGPAPVQPGGPPIVVGGHAPGALRRAARWGHGWIGGSAGPDAFRQGATAVGEAWREEGRTGRPRLLALAYFALGDHGPAAAGEYLRDYYASAGPFAERVVSQAATSPDEVRRLIEAYDRSGCDELLLMPCATDLEQVDMLAEAVGSA